MSDWDEAKRRAAAAKHGIDFAGIVRFDWASAVTRADTRHDYGEPRIISFGTLDGVICACAWTPRGDTVRVIILRQANARERKRYERDREAEKLYRRE